MDRRILPETSLASWETWETAYEDAVERNFFLNPAWARAVADTYPYKPFAFRFQFADQEIVLPCFANRRIRGTFYGLTSMPLTSYGGLLSSKPVTASRAAAIAQAISQDWKLHTLYVSALRPGGIAGWEGYRYGTYIRQVLDLTGGYAGIWSHSFTGAQRKAIRLAQRSSLEVRKGSSEADLNSFYRLFCATQTRLGVVHPYPKALLQGLFAAPTSSAELWLVSRGGLDIAGIVTGNNGRDAMIGCLAASDKSYWQYRPNNLLYATAIEDACKRHYQEFDFMTSGKGASLHFFKQSFGAADKAVATYMLQGRLPLTKRRLVSTWRRWTGHGRPML